MFSSLLLKPQAHRRCLRLCARPSRFSQVPVLFRVLFGLGMAACMVPPAPASAASSVGDLGPGNLVLPSGRELALMLGSIFVTGASS